MVEKSQRRFTSGFYFFFVLYHRPEVTPPLYSNHRSFPSDPTNEVSVFLLNTSHGIELDKGNCTDHKHHCTNIEKHYYKHKKQMLTIYRNNLSFLFLDILKKYLGAETHKSEQIATQYDIAFHIGGTFNHFMLWFSRDMDDTPEEMAEYTLAVLPSRLIEQMWNLPKQT